MTLPKGEPMIPPSTWRKLRIVAQVIAFILFLYVFIITPQNGIAGKVLSIPIRLSPLAMLGGSLAARILLPGLMLSILFLVVAIFFGRAWCGWLCPLGTLIEIFPIRRKRPKPIRESWRKGKYLLLLAILCAVVFRNLTLLPLDPLTIITRSFTFAVWPTFSYILQTMEEFLYQFPFLQPLVDWADNILRPAIFPISQFVFHQAFLFSGILLGLILLNSFAERFWCRYLCPLGGLLGWISRFAFIKRKVAPDCISCGKCARVCQTGTVDAENQYQSDPGECTLCMDCISACPNHSNRFSFSRQKSQGMGYDPTRREALIAISAAAAGIAAANTQPARESGFTYLIRPPGVTADDFLSQCVRCGECFRICPTNALQPTLIESGITGFWTPLVVARIGYCDYSCNSCGQICPVQAIPPLPLNAKRVTKIGSAYINQDLCIAWSDRRDCIVCEEMCPLPEKAITLSRRGSGKGSSEVLVPEVNRDLCIGCGICETKCPVVGEAAIRVRVPQGV